MVTREAPVSSGVIRGYTGENDNEGPFTLVNVAIAADRSGLHPHHIRRLIRQGRIPGHRVVDGTYYIIEDALPIHPVLVRKKTPLREKAVELVEAGLPDDLGENESQALRGYAAGYTLTDIAEGSDLGVTRQRMHQIIKATIEELSGE